MYAKCDDQIIKTQYRKMQCPSLLLTGGVLQGSGGSREAYPNHAQYLTLWNFETSGEKQTTLAFWPNEEGMHLGLVKCSWCLLLENVYPLFQSLELRERELGGVIVSVL